LKNRRRGRRSSTLDKPTAAAGPRIAPMPCMVALAPLQIQQWGPGRGRTGRSTPEKVVRAVHHLLFVMLVSVGDRFGLSLGVDGTIEGLRRIRRSVAVSATERQSLFKTSWRISSSFTAPLFWSPASWPPIWRGRGHGYLPPYTIPRGLLGRQPRGSVRQLKSIRGLPQTCHARRVFRNPPKERITASRSPFGGIEATALRNREQASRL